MPAFSRTHGTRSHPVATGPAAAVRSIYSGEQPLPHCTRLRLPDNVRIALKRCSRALHNNRWTCGVDCNLTQPRADVRTGGPECGDPGISALDFTVRHRRRVPVKEIHDG